MDFLIAQESQPASKAGRASVGCVQHPTEARDQTGRIIAPAEAIGELGEASRRVLVARRAECSSDSCLDVGERRVDRLERGMARRLTSGSGDDRLVRAAGIGNTSEAAEPVGDDTGAAFRNPSRQTCISLGRRHHI